MSEVGFHSTAPSREVLFPAGRVEAEAKGLERRETLRERVVTAWLGTRGFYEASRRGAPNKSVRSRELGSIALSIIRRRSRLGDTYSEREFEGIST